jgi:hypothetical protein
VRRSGLFTAVIQPPLLLFVGVPLAYYLIHESEFSGLKDILITCGYPLIERFPLMLFTSSAVLVIGLVRWYLVMSSPRRPQPAAAERPGVLAALSTKLSSAFAGNGSVDEEPGARPARPRHVADRAGNRTRQTQTRRTRGARPPAEEFALGELRRGAVRAPAARPAGTSGRRSRDAGPVNRAIRAALPRRRGGSVPTTGTTVWPGPPGAVDSSPMTPAAAISPTRRAVPGPTGTPTSPRTGRRTSPITSPGGGRPPPAGPAPTIRSHGCGTAIPDQSTAPTTSTGTGRPAARSAAAGSPGAGRTPKSHWPW